MSEIIDKVKHAVGAGVVTGLSALVIYLAGCATTYHERLTKDGPIEKTVVPGGPASIEFPEIKTPEDYNTVLNMKNNICNQIKERLEKEKKFDKIECYLHDFGDGKDVVIRAYKKTEDGQWPNWGFNFDCVCRSVLKEKKLMFFDLSDKVQNEMCDLNTTTSPSFSHGAAEQLHQIVTKYIENNIDRCREWFKFYQENIGPRGPVAK